MKIKAYHAALFLTAFAVRLLYLMSGNAWTAGDSKDYLDIANNLLNFNGFIISGQATTFRAPLYPFFVAALGANADLVLFMQAFLGAASFTALSGDRKD